MNNALKAGNSLAQKLFRQFGQLPDANFQDDRVDLFVPRESITESGSMVAWLNDLIEAMEKTGANAEMLSRLKITYFMFRDCSLLARYQLSLMDAQAPEMFQNRDLMIRFKEHPQTPNTVMMEIGAAIPKDPEKEPPIGAE